MTITNVKAMIAKSLTAGLVAAALFIAAPSKANAQVAFGVRIGGPVAVYGHVRPVYAPPVYGGYYGPGFYGPRYGYGRHEAWVRHEEFARGRGYYGR